MNSIVAIPYYEVDPGKRDVLKKCLHSFRGYNTIVLAGKQKTLSTAWNMCLDLGFGMGYDYVILSNDDVILSRGDLEKLCVPGKVVSPTVNRGVFKVFHAHIFCIPKEVYEEVGKFDESFQIYWADTDYAVRLKKAGIPVEIEYGVDVTHPEAARTLNAMPKKMEQEDKETFYKKHGTLWTDPIREIL